MLVIGVTLLLALVQAGAPLAPEAAVARLLETDRSFSTRGAGRPAVGSISAMFADDVTVLDTGNPKAVEIGSPEGLRYKHLTFDAQPSTFNIQRSTFNVQPSLTRSPSAPASLAPDGSAASASSRSAPVLP